MRNLFRAVVVFVCAGVLLAESPFAGTWKLDSAKTKYTTGTPPKDVTLTIEEQGDMMQVTASGTNSDGSPISVKYVIPASGGVAKVQEGPYEGITSKRISDTVRHNTYTKDGKQVSTRHLVVSKDGKTLRSTVKGTNVLGQAVSGTDVFEKQ